MKKKNDVDGAVKVEIIRGSTELAARSKFAKTHTAETAVERKAVECYGVLAVAELGFTPGREFGQAVLDLRDEIKKNGSRNFMTRLEELGIPYAKARYWMAIVEEKPINRGNAKKASAKGGDSVREQEKLSVDWREDWGAVMARFRELADVIILLAQRHRRDGGRRSRVS